MNISLVINSLSAGGAEKNATILAGGLAARGHSVSLTTLSPEIPDFFPCPTGVRRATLHSSGVCRWFDPLSQLRRLTSLRRELKAQSPDVIISFIDVTNVLTLIALPSGTPPVIVCERIHPKYNPLGLHWRILRRMLYPRAAKVVMLTREALAWAQNLSPRWNAIAIPNPVQDKPLSPGLSRPDFFLLRNNLVAIGRLDKQKGFDILLSSFSEIAACFPEWQLTILGEGAERTSLEKLISSLGLSGRVALPGFVSNPADVLRFSDLFVMSSRYEGFPNALTEALACGVPAVSFDCPSGPAEILRNGVDGLLIPAGDRRALAAAMAALMSDKEKRKNMAANAPDIVTRFGLKGYIDSWERLLNAVHPA